MLKKTKGMRPGAAKTNYKNREQSDVLSNAAPMSEIYRWRGGKSLFQQKLLHRSLAFKRGRRAPDSFLCNIFIFVLLKVF